MPANSNEIKKEKVCSMTPTEFEKYCKEILSGYAERESLQDFTITHDKKVKTDDGTYQIDIYAEFTALGARFKVICECKRYNNPISREKVAVLFDKIRAIGAQKGILLSTAEFQSGAIQYAKKHGIALIQVYDRGCDYLSHSAGPGVVSENDPFTYAERMLPPYKAVLCTEELFEEPVVVYPTKSMMKEIYDTMDRMIEEQYGVKRHHISENP